MLKSVNKRASDILKQLKTPNNDLIPQIVYIGKNSANQWWIYETYFKEGIPSDSKTYYIDDAKEYQDYLQCAVKSRLKLNLYLKVISVL